MKNYKNIYESGNASSAIIQKFYLKEESVRGQLVIPAGTDFFYTLAGGSLRLTQPFESSPHKTGRHHTNIIPGKKVGEWSFSTFINIDTAEAQGVSEIDPALRTLWTAMLGTETVLAGVNYTSNDAPSKTFSIFECGDMWSQQAYGGFVNTLDIDLPGDGNSTLAWGGNFKGRYLVGIGKCSVDASGGNDITLQAGEGKRFPVGCKVMLIENDGYTRSADTVDGSPRTVTAVNGDVITLDGAVLADADGSVSPIFLNYYEPESPEAIDNPQTGLVGSLSIDDLPNQECFRSMAISLNNNHEVVNYCFGQDELGGNLFIPGDRISVGVSMDLNLDLSIVEYINKLQSFEASAITVKVGNALSRYFEVVMPKLIFNVPEISVPESGSIPVSFSTDNALQTGLDQADEFTASYK